jgi:O-antigen ligase
MTGTRPDAVLWALAMMHLTYVWRLPSIVTILQPLRLAVVTGVVAVALFLLDRSPRRRLIDLPATPVRLTVLMLSLMTLSVPAGIHPGNSATYLAKSVIPTLLLMIMLATSMRSAADVEWFAMFNLRAAAAYCVFVLVYVRVGSDGRLQEMGYYDSNDLGLLLVSTLPLAVYFATRAHRWTRRLLAGMCTLLFLFVLLRTGSRGAFVGLMCTMVYMAAFYQGFALRTRVVAVTSFMGFFVLIGGASYMAKVSTLLHPTSDYNWSGNSSTGRLEIWKRGIGYLIERPLLGVGVDNFKRAEGNLSDIGREMASRGRPFKWSVAHNSYLEMAAEAGLVACMAYVGLFATAFRLLRRVTLATSRLAFTSRELVLAQTLAAALMGYVVCAFFISAEYFVYPYVLVGLAMGITKVTLARSFTPSVAQ